MTPSSQPHPGRNGPPIHRPGRYLLMLFLFTAACYAQAQQPTSTSSPPPATRDHQTTSVWHERLYAQYDPAAFANFAPANKPIVRDRVDRPLLAAAIFYATNEQRVRRGGEPFKFYNALAEAAAGHSEAMARHGFFSHVNTFDKSARTMADRFNLKKMPEGAWGENIAYTPVDEQSGETYLAFARKMLKQWMASRGHRENILNSKFNFLGCGIGVTEKEGVLYITATQAFSREAKPEKQRVN